jgi:hypothetical protein
VDEFSVVLRGFVASSRFSQRHTHQKTNENRRRQMGNWILGRAARAGLPMCIAGLVVLSVTQPSCFADGLPNTASNTFSMVIVDYATVPELQAQIASDTVTKQQSEMGQRLYAQLIKEDLPPYARAEVITLLGRLRFHQATYELIKNINFRYTGDKEGSRRIPINPLKTPGFFRYLGFPARNALQAIGPVAAQTIYEVINSKDTHRLNSFNESQVDGFVEVLQGIEGRRWALLKLETLQAEATDPEIKARYAMLIKRYKERVQM